MSDYTPRHLMRLVTRLCEPGDGLVLGIMLKGGVGYLKPSTVYELSEVAGQLLLREVGRALPAHDGEKVTDAPLHLTWGQDVAQILGIGGPYLALSREEFASLRPRDPQDDL